MPNLFRIPKLDVPVPQFPGVGAAVDISGQTSILTCLLFGSADDSVVLEQSFDGTNYAAVFSAVGPATGIIEAEGNWIRARKLSGSGAAYNAHVGQQSQTGVSSTQTGPVSENTGNGTSQLISLQPPNLNLLFEGPGNDSIGLQHSFDGVAFAPLAQLIQSVLTPVTCGTNWIRPVRGVGGVAGTLQINGVPKAV